MATTELETVRILLDSRCQTARVPLLHRVGKTSLVRCLQGEEFNPNQPRTSLDNWVDHKSHNTTIWNSHKGAEFRVVEEFDGVVDVVPYFTTIIRDTPLACCMINSYGSHSTGDIVLRICPGAGAVAQSHLSQIANEGWLVIEVFDLSSPGSLEESKERLGFLANRPNPCLLPVALVGNKSDLERVYSWQDGEAAAGTFHVPYFETSSKTGEGVRVMFETVLKEHAARIGRSIISHVKSARN